MFFLPTCSCVLASVTESVTEKSVELCVPNITKQAHFCLKFSLKEKNELEEVKSYVMRDH